MENLKKTIKQYAVKLGSLEAEEESDKKIRNLLRTEKPDVIFHLAALARIQPSFEKPFLTLNNNITGTIAACDLARLKNAKLEVELNNYKTN